MNVIWGMIEHVSNARHAIPASGGQKTHANGALMKNDLLFLSMTGAKPAVDRPAADRLIAGDPVFSTWNHDERDGLFCGMWQSTPGKWRVVYTEWEYCHILSGVSVLASDTGPARTVRAGDRFIIQPGFTGTWDVVETTTKDYVIRL
jgi:uncharacterized protein